MAADYSQIAKCAISTFGSAENFVVRCEVAWPAEKWNDLPLHWTPSISRIDACAHLEHGDVVPVRVEVLAIGNRNKRRLAGAKEIDGITAVVERDDSAQGCRLRRMCQCACSH